MAFRMSDHSRQWTFCPPLTLPSCSVPARAWVAVAVALPLPGSNAGTCTFRCLAQSCPQWIWIGGGAGKAMLTVAGDAGVNAENWFWGPSPARIGISDDDDISQ